MQELESTLFKERYSLNQIVYINSAGYGYGELPLDDHLAIFAPNNIGKTGTLAGTKIALFPLSTFKQTEKTFRFVGSSGAFSTEDSYQYYFPSNESFILMEATNPSGTFTMICCKGKDYGYDRFFIPKSYAEIRHHFFDQSTDEINQDISIAGIKELTKSLNGIQPKDDANLREIMYGSRNSVDPRFCVLPLVDANKETTRAFTNIYQLAFESSLPMNLLPSIVASLVEMNRSREKEKLNANLHEIVTQHGILSKEQDELQQLENAEPTYEQAKELYDASIATQTDYAVRMHQAEHYYSQSINEVTPKLSALTESLTQVTHDYSQHQKSLKDQQNEKHQYLGIQRAENSALATFQNDLKVATDLKLTYPEAMPWDEIRSILIEGIDDIKQKLDAMASHATAQTQLQSALRERNRLLQDQSELAHTIDNFDAAMLRKLPADMASFYYALNKNLANIIHNPTSQEMAALNAFYAAFRKSDSFYYFGDATTGPISEQLIDLNDQLKLNQNKKTQVDFEIIKINDKIADLNDTLKSSVSSLEIEKQRASKELQQLERQLECLNARETNHHHVQAKQASLLATQSAIDSLDLSIQSSTLLSQELQDQRYAIQRNIDELNRQSSTLSALANDIKAAKGHLLPTDTPELEHPAEFEYQAGELLRRAYAAKEESNKAIRAYDALVAYYPLPGDTVPHISNKSLIHVQSSLAAYDLRYQSLAADKRNLINKITTHNQTLQLQLNEIKEAQETVIREINHINTEINQRKISNLAEISLSVTFKADFMSIIPTLMKHDITQDALLSEDFYRTLIKISNTYFSTASGRINLRDIIDRISMNYKKEGSNELERKSQSGGTTSTATAFLISVLLGRIASQHTTLHMPIIIDEISSLDAQNIKSTVDLIKDHGFSVFCATPDFTTKVVIATGSYILLGKHQLSRPMVKGCHTKQLADYIVRFGEK